MGTKSQAEIDAEKAGKPRPDLLPARALIKLDAYCSDDSVPDNHEPRAVCRDALLSLRAFRQYVDIDYAIAAMACVADLLGGPYYAAMRGGAVMGYGYRKHGRCTWRVAGTEQADPQTHLASAERHLLEWLIDCNATEEGSGFPVLWHAFSQLAILIDLWLDPPTRVGENDEHGMVTGRQPVTSS